MNLPRWIDVAVIPLANVALALVAAGLLVVAIGENPLAAARILFSGAFGDGVAIGYTLYYTTNFIFTGLAVAVAFHAGHFNIGGEGQAYIGGLGIGVAMLALDGWLPSMLLIPIGILAAMTFGMAWAAVPAYLQAYRGSHVVITTIMFNFIAAALMVYLVVDIFTQPGSLLTESRELRPAAHMPSVQTAAGWFGIALPRTPFNLSFALALLACVAVHVFLWRTRPGYALRTAGASPRAARYAGIRPERVTIWSMCLSGALAGLVGVNEIAGVHHKILLDFVLGAGFTGIAVALMGRNHPVGIVLASLLFGTLFQGGAELAFEIPAFSREMVVTMQGFVVLFSGALAYMMRPWVARAYARLATRPAAT